MTLPAQTSGGWVPDWGKILALFQRELRVASRTRSNYWLRVVGAGVVLYALGAIHNQSLYTPQGAGQGVFRGLNWLLAGFIWLVAPVMTSDCLSREKREGTLPLLFLTSLRPVELVLAKSFVHFIRAGMLLMAAVPVMLIPVLFGGVSAIDAVRAVLLHSAALFLALTSGLTASALTRHWVASRLVASALTVLSSLFFVICHIGARVVYFWSMSPARAGGMSLQQLITFEVNGLLLRLTSSTVFWANRAGGAPSWSSIGLALVVVAVAVITSAVAMGFAAHVISRTWRDEPAKQGSSDTTPDATGKKRRWNILGPRRVLAGEGDPFMLIHTRRPRARMERAMWFFLVMSVMSVSCFGTWSGVSTLQGVMGISLMVGMAISACSSFTQEFENGALELLLVTPRRPRELLLGRLKAMYWTFFPSLIALATVPVVIGFGRHGWTPAVVVVFWYSVALFLVLGVELGVMGLVGMALSISGFPFPGALFLSVMLVVGLPYPLIQAALGHGGVGGYWTLVAALLLVILQVVNVVRSWVFAERQLAQRGFLKS